VNISYFMSAKINLSDVGDTLMKNYKFKVVAESSNFSRL